MNDEEKITYFAETDSRNQRIPFGIKSKDRSRHVYVIGKTGMGKSTLLENMAIQDIRDGEGLAFVDPHGKTADLLLDYVPEKRIKDVLYFAPFDTDFPLAFNVMEDVGYDKRHLVVSGLMSAFKKIWVDAWSARMEYILSNTLLALLEYPDSTLLDINRMLVNKDFRKKVVENIKDPSVKSFWVDEFAKYTDRYTQEATPAIQNKVGQFTSNPLIRNIVGQPKSTFDLRKMMDEKKILIINLSKGRIGETNANLLGSMIITKIYLAAMSRADVPESQLPKLPNFFLYVDEFQSFANESFADILSEARKYKLSLTLAHQYIEQMSEEVRAAVFGNVGTMITFRVGAFDAEFLEKEFAPQFTAVDLVNLGFIQIYLKLMIDGVSSAPFSATTLPPLEQESQSFREQVINFSRAQFARPRDSIEALVAERQQLGNPPPKTSVPPAENREPKRDNKNETSSGNSSSNNFRKNRLPVGRREARFDKKIVEKEMAASAPAKNPFAEIALNRGKIVVKKENTPERPSSATPSVPSNQLGNPNASKNRIKKGPSDKNLSELRSALSAVLSSEKKEPEKVSQKNRPQFDKQASPAPKRPENHNPSGSGSAKEVPEDVLRKVLKGEHK